MASNRAIPSHSLKFGDAFELDVRAYELRYSGQSLKLERIPMDPLLLLVEQRGQLVTRDQIVERIWGKDVFLDTDNSINAAIRKIRQVLRDDPEQPRFVQTSQGAPIGSSPLEEIGTPLEPPATSETQPNSAENLLGKKVSHYRIPANVGWRRHGSGVFGKKT
jgi:Transcriptional regulatory protein, C terminal